MKFRRLVLAGTFDRFHQGHAKFIKKSLLQTDFASCGICTDWISREKGFSSSLQPFKQRTLAVKRFLKINSLGQKTQIFKLNDPFGPAIKQNFDAVAATEESFKGVQQLNQRRKAQGKKPLPVFLVDLVLSQDKKRISSTRIRAGQINRQGLVYSLYLDKKRSYWLPKHERLHFKKPMGQLLSGAKNNIGWAGLQAQKTLKKKGSPPPLIISVGDISTQSFILNNLPVNLAVYDQRCQRQPINFKFHQELKNQAGFYFKVKNYPGTLTSYSLKALSLALIKMVSQKQSGAIQVQGEEDLLVLPLILLSPLNTLIFYGQPGQGLVQVKVKEKTKEKALLLFKKFKSELTRQS